MRRVFVVLSSILTLWAPALAHADLISNGDFSAGLGGWQTSVQTSFDGDIFPTTGGLGAAPLSGLDIASNGTQYALTDGAGPGQYTLSQTFSASGLVNIQFDLFAQNQFPDTFCTAGLDALNPFGDPVQCARASLIDSSNNVVQTFYEGADCIGGVATCLAPFQHYNFDVNLTPGTYTLAFQEADNLLNFEMGVDNVSVNAAVPEPGSLVLLGSGLIALAAKLRKRFAV